jgi:hypothetical protein
LKRPRYNAGSFFITGHFSATPQHEREFILFKPNYSFEKRQKELAKKKKKEEKRLRKLEKQKNPTTEEANEPLAEE